MSQDIQTLVYLAIFIAIALVLLLIGVVVSYLRLINKYLALKEGRDTQLDPRVIIATAQAKAQKVVEDAHVAARETLAKSDKYLQGESGLVAKELERMGQIYAKTYEEALINMQQASLRTFANIPQDIKLFVVKALDDFRLTLSAEVARAQTQTLAALEQSIKGAEAEIDKYKEGRMRQIDVSAAKLVTEVTRKVLGKSISVDEHEKLVMRALEEAKRQNIF